MTRSSTATIFASLAVLTACTGPPAAPPDDRSAPPRITGRVVGLDGSPLAGATVVSGGSKTTADTTGWFRVEPSEDAGGGPQWVTVRRSGFVSRTRAAVAGDPVLVRLTPDDGTTISLHFVGDMMMGRRFYDRNEDGDTSDGLLHPGAGVREHLALLRPVEPLLANADLSIGNLETPLADHPYYDPTNIRPKGFHPTKEFAFATAPAAAVAFSRAGLDLVGLGNNHLYDRLEPGVKDTLKGLQRAGLKYFGGGLDEAMAWKPAVVHVRGQSLAFLGCTTITRTLSGYYKGRPVPKHGISYVASDAENKGGAAACELDRIRAAVADAKRKYDLVIFQIHGGEEYVRTPAPFIRPLAEAARKAGAALVINHHSHVVSGFDWNGSGLIAWSMGNFVFDATVWPSLESYLLNVDIKDGRVVRAYTEPLILDDFLPRGLTAGLADHPSREAAGEWRGPVLLEDGAMEVDALHRAERQRKVFQLSGGRRRGTIFRLANGTFASGDASPDGLRLGRDLLWVGSFEDDDVDAENDEADLWNLHGPDKVVRPRYGIRGSLGARLTRNAANAGDVVLTPVHRVLVRSGSRVSVVGMARGTPGAELKLQLSWFRDTRGHSARRTIAPIHLRGGRAWTPFRVDAIVPPDIVRPMNPGGPKGAVGLYIRLSPAKRGVVTADLDDLALIQWAGPGTHPRPLYDYVRVKGTLELTVTAAYLPGGAAWAKAERPVAIG